MAALPLLRVVQTLVLVAELFALLFFAHICTPLIPLDKSVYCSGQLVPLNVTNRTDVRMDWTPTTQFSTLETNVSSELVAHYRQCIRIEMNELFAWPNTRHLQGKEVVLTFLSVMIWAVGADLIAALIICRVESRTENAVDWVCRAVMWCSLLIELVQGVLCLYIYANWDNFWTLNQLSLQLPINFYAVAALVAISFVASFVDTCLWTPRATFTHPTDYSHNLDARQFDVPNYHRLTSID